MFESLARTVSILMIILLILSVWGVTEAHSENLNEEGQVIPSSTSGGPMFQTNS